VIIRKSTIPVSIPGSKYPRRRAYRGLHFNEIERENPIRNENTTTPNTPKSNIGGPNIVEVIVASGLPPKTLDIMVLGPIPGPGKIERSKSPLVSPQG